MTKALSTVATQEPRLPAIRGGIPPASARTAALTSHLHNHLEPIPGNFRRYALSAAHEPTPEQRALLLDRRQEIDAGLVGADERKVRENVGILRSSMATASMSEDAAKLARQGFIMVLGRYPVWAVTETAMRFLDGRAGNKVYAPTAAEMAEVCRALISEPLAERARINAILDAEVYHLPTEAERAEVARRHEEFVREAAKAADPRRMRVGEEPAGTDAVERASAERRLAEMRAEAERDAAGSADVETPAETSSNKEPSE